MPALKNPRYEMWVREYIKTGNKTEAHRRVYPPSTPDAHKTRGWKIFHRSLEVQERYNELLERQMKKSDISIDKILTDCQHALDVAKEQNKPAEIVGAAMAQAKLVGLLRDRVETGGVGDFENVTDISEILEIVGKEAGPAAALALSKAFNLTTKSHSEALAPEAEQDLGLSEAKPASDAMN